MAAVQHSHIQLQQNHGRVRVDKIESLDAIDPRGGPALQLVMAERGSTYSVRSRQKAAAPCDRIPPAQSPVRGRAHSIEQWLRGGLIVDVRRSAAWRGVALVVYAVPRHNMLVGR